MTSYEVVARIDAEKLDKAIAENSDLAVLIAQELASYERVYGCSEDGGKEEGEGDDRSRS